MTLLDSAHALLDEALPARHQIAAGSLLFGLCLITMLPGTVEYDEEQQNSSAFALSHFDTLTPPLRLPALPLPDYPAPLFTQAPRLSANAATAPDLLRYETEVKPGDNLSQIFARAGLAASEVYQVANSGEEARILSRLHPGYAFTFELTPERRLKSLQVVKSPLESWRFTRNADDGFDIDKIERQPELRQAVKAARIQDSLFMTAQRNGIPAALVLELANLFGGVIDFMQDSREGDAFNVVYEEKYLDGKLIGTGDILAAQFSNKGKTHTALRYQNLNGDVAYYSPEGESMRKAFLLNPVDFTRISSGFNLSRRHPILNTIRAHKGTDYAAPTGTPVVATAEGVVTWADRNGSFGKLVVLRHGDRFETKYAHLNDYARGLKKGAKVSQGQVIGYVGSTGSATGPHLHYEFLMDGVHRNSRTIDQLVPTGLPLAKEELALFRAQADVLLALIESQNDNLALAQAQTNPAANVE